MPQNDLSPVIQGTAVIKHDSRLASWSQYAMDLADGARGVRRVMQHAVRIDNVKRLVGKRQLFAVRECKVGMLAVNRKMLSRNLDRARRQIHSGHLRAAARKLEQVSSHAATDFEQALTRKLIK